VNRVLAEGRPHIVDMDKTRRSRARDQHGRGAPQRDYRLAPNPHLSLCRRV
jgi:hypothetical protein